MKAPNNKVVGITIVLVTAVLGFWLMGREDDEQGKPTVREAESRATIERNLREGETLEGPDDSPFRLRYPDTWEPIERHQLPQFDPSPLAGLRRTNNAALLTVTVGPPVEGGLARLERELPGQVEGSADDVRLDAIRRVRVAAGPALYASFTRTASGQIQTVLIVPDGNVRAFRVDAAVRPEARDAAAQLGAMLRTFDVAGR